jgi:signal transduction histidine kinase/tetratricopeptide (TPR) repeat protein
MFGFRGALILASAFLCALPAKAAAPAPDQSSQFDAMIARAQKTMMADPAAALKDAQAATAIAKSQQSSPAAREAYATALWLSSEAQMRTDHIPEARASLQTATAIAGHDNKLTALDGNLALSRARLADMTGDVALALKNYQDAHSIFVHLGNARKQSMSLMGIGSIYDEAHDYAREIKYYRDALQVYSGDPALELSAANNVGIALEQSGRYREARERFRRAFSLAASLQSSMLQARILENIAMSYARQHKLAEADAAANRASKILRKGDEGHWAPFVWAVKADVEYQRGNTAKAKDYIGRTFKGIDLATTIAPFRDAHEIAWKVYRAAGQYQLALAHHEAFKRLDDEGRSLAASANAALSGARFDFTNQNLEIERLRSAQLQRDISLKESRAATQRVIFLSIFLAGLILAVWIAWRLVLARRHRNAIAQKNVQLTKSLSERNQEIERRKEAETQLRIAMETAQQANRAKSHFLANMSHELRTPLNAIIGFAELMGGGTTKPDKVQEYSDIIANGGRHLLSILTDILDMARIEAGRVALEESAVAIGSVIDDAMATVRSTTSAAESRIHVDDTNWDVTIFADEARLRQVIANLLSNAVKFSGEDGVAHIAVERVVDGIDIVIRDNGPGIAEEQIAAVMEPFGQVESSYARSHGGTGLGLPIAKALVELHGGRLSLASSGEGTIARIHLAADRIIGEDQDRPHFRALSATAAV